MALAKERSVLESVDHLLLGAPDLDKAVTWFAEAAGVQPAIGGTHPGMGTRNALVSLSGRHYLEIIAPDPAQTQFNFQIDLRALTAPHLVTWAAAPHDMEAVLKQARAAGLSVFGPREGARKRPDGRMLQWRSAGVVTDLRSATVDPVPFLIQWDDGSVHPSADAPPGCALVSISLRHPDPDRLQRTLATLGIHATIDRGDSPGVEAVLTTPKGELRLSSS